MQEIAVRGVQREDFESRGMRASRGLPVSLEHDLEIALLEAARLDPFVADRRIAGRDDLPGLVAALEVSLRERPVAIPRTRHAALAAGVRELERRDRALALHEAGDSSQPFDMRVVPDA